MGVSQCTNYLVTLCCYLAFDVVVVERSSVVMQEIERLKQEEEDRKLALSLQEQQPSTAPPAAIKPFASTLNAGRIYSPPKVSLVGCSISCNA